MDSATPATTPLFEIYEWCDNMCDGECLTYYDICLKERIAEQDTKPNTLAQEIEFQRWLKTEIIELCSIRFEELEEFTGLGLRALLTSIVERYKEKGNKEA